MELADCCARSGRIEAAKERFLSLIAYLEKHRLRERDLKLKPNVYYNYAMFLFFAARHYPEAAVAFGEFAKKFPRERRATSALFRSAESWEKMGQLEEAKRILGDIQKNFAPRSLPYRKAERRLKKLQEESEKPDLNTKQ